jgi:hypothetical protein
MSEERKRPDRPKSGRKKPGAGERKRRYSEPPLPKSAPSRKTGINQHKEEPDPMKERVKRKKRA